MAVFNVGQKKSVCRIFSMEDFARTEKELKDCQLQPIVDISLALESYDQNVIDKLNALLSKIPDSVQKSIIIENDDLKLKIRDLESFIDLEEAMSKGNNAFFIEEGFEYHTLTETINATEQVDRFAERIRKMDASPLEKYLVIYNNLFRKV